MAALDRGDRVELDAAKPAYARFHIAIIRAAESAGEALPGDDVSPQIRERKRARRVRRPRPAARPILLPIFAANTDS